MHSANLPLTPTLSIGISSAQGETATLDTLLSQADQALYLAKRNGRNCLYPMV